MPPKHNPLKLNALQCKTLVLFQELARNPATGSPVPGGDILLSTLPQPHGDHFHVGSKVVASRDATGLANQAVWTALERKGLIRGTFPLALRLTPEGQAYDTGMAHEILHGSDH